MRWLPQQPLFTPAPEHRQVEEENLSARIEGPQAEQARTARDELLSRRPELREEYEARAREFIAARRVPEEPG